MRRIAITAAVSAAALLGATSTALAAKGMEVAISDEDAIVTGKAGNRAVALQTAQALNATRMRILVQWNRVSDAASTTPSGNPDYNWREIDDAIDLAALAGMRTMLTLTGPAPAYASGNRKPDFPVVRPNPQRYAEFVRAAATHFKGRVDRYAVWNEPNLPVWLSPSRTSPKQYRALYEAAYGAIKAVDPAAQVLIGETVPYGGRQAPRRGARLKRLGLATEPLKWLRGVLCVDARYRRTGCKPLVADGYAHHPYDLTLGLPVRRGNFPGKDNAPIQTLSNLRSALRKFDRIRALSDPKGRPLQVYLTESGYFVNGKRALPAAKRAKYLRDQFELAVREPGVRSMLQYNIYTPTNTTFTTGLLQPNGNPLPDLRSLIGWTQAAARNNRVKRNTGPISIPGRPVGATGETQAPPPTVPPTQPGCLLEISGICVVPQA